MNNDFATLSGLESHLWEAANILRGPVDAADFKTYVFPLLFFKRLSDVHDEEYQAALAESGGDEEYAQFPQNYQFQVPENCHWNDVRAVTVNVGQALQKAMRCIEKANPETLYGIFGDAQWTNKERLSDSLLHDLIEHFSRINLGNHATQADILGQWISTLSRSSPMQPTKRRASSTLRVRSCGLWLTCSTLRKASPSTIQLAERAACSWRQSTM